MSEKDQFTIWGRGNSANVMKVLWAAEELGLPFQRHDVGGTFGYDHVPEFARLNPNFKVPAIQEGGNIFWESNVIVRYLSEKYGRGTLWPKDNLQRWEAEKWMDWQQTTISRPLSAILYETVRKPPAERNPDVTEAARQECLTAWKVLEAQLQDHAYILGDQLTMADIPTGVWIHRWFAYQIERPEFPNIAAWYGRLQQRPEYQKHAMVPLT